jgi:signal transduction histidine kinase
MASERAAGNAAVTGDLQAIAERVEAAIDELREVSRGLSPPVLAELGLVGALEHIREHANTPLEFNADGVGRHSADVESAVYYCCVEAIQNATRHGGPAVRVSVTLREQADALKLEVSDDGVGYDPAEMHAGAGLQNMRDRLGALDGRLSIVTAAGHGTVVAGSIPLLGAARGHERPARTTSSSGLSGDRDQR